MLFIGNKCDLDHDRVVSKEHGKAVADELGGGRIGHHETSAKSNINVTEVYCGGRKEKLLICFQIKSNNVIEYIVLIFHIFITLSDISRYYPCDKS